MRNAIGVDIGGTSVRAARVSEAGGILAHERAPTPPTPAAALELVDALIARLADASSVAIGIGVPGRVNATTGEILSGGYVNLAGPPLNRRLKASAGRTLFVDNDASMALVGEANVGGGRGMSNVVLLTIGTGIGGAILMGGAIVRGGGGAGQLGHVTVDVNGSPCACGRSGCLETTSSGTALRRYIAEAALPATTTCEELLGSNDAISRSIVDRWAGPLRAGIDSLVATLDPELVLLGGGLGGEAVKALERHPPRSAWFQRPVAAAALGDKAGVIGAALAALGSAG